MVWLLQQMKALYLCRKKITMLFKSEAFWLSKWTKRVNEELRLEAILKSLQGTIAAFPPGTPV